MLLITGRAVWSTLKGIKMSLYLVTVELDSNGARTAYRVHATGPEAAAFLAIRLAKRAGVVVHAIGAARLGE